METETVKSDEIIVDGNDVYRMVDNELFIGWQKLEVQKARPGIFWKKAKIPWSLWLSIVSFLKWTQDRDGDEGLVHLFFNPESNQWDAWAPPQKGVGMTVNSLDCDEYKAQRKQWPDPWFQCGSVHHHCKSSAGHSSVDDKDEDDREGVHITLGHMDKDEMSCDVRAIFGGTWVKGDIADWVAPAFDTEATGLPKKYIDQVAASMALDLEIVPRENFPEVWKKNFCMGSVKTIQGDPEVEKIKTNYSSYSGPPSNPHVNGYWHNGQFVDTSKRSYSPSGGTPAQQQFPFGKKKKKEQKKQCKGSQVRLERSDSPRLELAELGIDTVELATEARKVCQNEWEIYQLYTYFYWVNQNQDDLDKFYDHKQTLTKVKGLAFKLWDKVNGDLIKKVDDEALFDTTAEEFIHTKTYQDDWDAMQQELNGGVLYYVKPLFKDEDRADRPILYIVFANLMIEVLEHHFPCLLELEDLDFDGTEA